MQRNDETLHCELSDTAACGLCMCTHVQRDFHPLFTFVWLNLCLCCCLLKAASSGRELMAASGSFDKVDLVSQAYFQAALPGRQVQFS